MTTQTQRQRVRKARVALILYRAYGRVPNEDKIERSFQMSRALYTAGLDARNRHRPHERGGQLALL
jgi:hypothetical protein